MNRVLHMYCMYCGLKLYGIIEKHRNWIFLNKNAETCQLSSKINSNFLLYFQFPETLDQASEPVETWTGSLSMSELTRTCYVTPSSRREAEELLIMFGSLIHRDLKHIWTKPSTHMVKMWKAKTQAQKAWKGWNGKNVLVNSFSSCRKTDCTIQDRWAKDERMKDKVRHKT